MTDPITGSVQVGGYVLEVGPATESYATFETEREAVPERSDEER